MKYPVFTLLTAFLLVPFAAGAEPEMSEETETCIECHASVTPGIVADWRASRHSRISPARALKKPVLSRRMSAPRAPKGAAGHSVGCAECHTANSKDHMDSFDHNGFSVHVVVTPKDCAACHPTEAAQYGENLMSHAYGNLRNNTLYMSLVRSAIGVQAFKDMRVEQAPPDAMIEAESCFYCHGTVVKRKCMQTRDTDFGEMTFPVLAGWPNQGVGRLNPDGSMGSCTSCHARHEFSIEMARKPYTCSECHKGPDVPGYRVFQVSKHGNLFFSQGKSWDFEAVPWTVGKDFKAPTCAACHVSLITSDGGEVIARRTHRMNDRSPWRILGLIYAHPHSKSPDTTAIRNKSGLPLPTEFAGKPSEKFLIDKTEQKRRRAAMGKVCLACHSLGWVQGDSIFNKAIEKKWAEQWLFYANSTRYAAAMMGADYGTFANGRWYMSKNIEEMREWLEFRLETSKGNGSKEEKR